MKQLIQIIQNFSSFLKSLLSEDNDNKKPSSKRVISILSFILLTTMILISFKTGKSIDSTYIYVVAGLIAGTTSLSTIEKFKK